MVDGRNALLVFREVARSVDMRTIIPCIVPTVACNHKLPSIALPKDKPIQLLCFYSCLSSFVLDYFARQKLGGTSVSLFVLKQLPILSPSEYSKTCSWFKQSSLDLWISTRVLELTYTSWDLEAFAKDCSYNGSPFQWNEERRFLLRCELDVAYFHLYGIQRDDVSYIMETFPIVNRKDKKM